MPQSVEAAIEALELMSVERLILSPQSNRPVMGIVQDALLGAREMSSRDTFFDRAEFLQLLCWMPNFAGSIPEPAVLKSPRGALWTGKQLLSALLPAGLDLERVNSEHADSDDEYDREPDLLPCRTRHRRSPADDAVKSEKVEQDAAAVQKSERDATATATIEKVLWHATARDGRTLYRVRCRRGGCWLGRGGDAREGWIEAAELRDAAAAVRPDGSKVVAAPGSLLCDGDRPGSWKLARYWRRQCQAADTRVEVRDGELLCGTLCSRTLGRSQGSLIHVLFADYGPTVTLDFFNGIQRTINAWLIDRGFSVGLDDMMPDRAAREHVRRTVSHSEETIRQWTRREAFGVGDAADDESAFEQRVNRLLNDTRNLANAATMETLPSSNSLKKMVLAGSKGSSANMSNMLRCIGQQNIEGQRVPFGFQVRSFGWAFASLTFRERQGRTLPHFTRSDHGAASRGYIDDCYALGLQPHAFFFHAMAGREGLIDTAIKTSQTGYIQRRLNKAMEDIGSQYDGTVRNAQGDVIQFAYGEDGYDAARLEIQHIDLPLTDSDDAFVRRFAWQPDDRDADARCVDTSDLHLRRELQRLRLDVAAMARRPGKSRSPLPLPVHLQRLLQRAKRRPRTAEDSPVCAATVARDVFRLQQRLWKMLPTGAERDESPFACLLRSTLASKRVLREHRLHVGAWKWLLEELERQFRRALIQPGEMVGTLAAQSIGEPATQMTLNTFHHAGISNRGMTLGVPRLSELINVCRNPRTPSLTVRLKPEVAGNRRLVEHVRRSMEYCTLRHVVQRFEILYEPDPSRTSVAADAEMVQSFEQLCGKDGTDRDSASPWVLRLVLDRRALAKHRLRLERVGTRITDAFGVALCLDWNDECCDPPVVRARLRAHDEGALPGEDEALLRSLALQMLDGVHLGGVAGIRSCFVPEDALVLSGGRPATEWTIVSEGVNLAEAMVLPGVDGVHTTSNDPNEVLRVLGIEAAHSCLLQELHAVITLDNYVDWRHLMMLISAMTHRGYLLSITRHGINRVESGPLMRSSFEEQVGFPFFVRLLRV